MRADCIFAITAAWALALVAVCSATDQPVVQETVQETAPDTAYVAAQGATPGRAGVMVQIQEAEFDRELAERPWERTGPEVYCRLQEGHQGRLAREGGRSGQRG